MQRLSALSPAPVSWRRRLVGVFAAGALMLSACGDSDNEVTTEPTTDDAPQQDIEVNDPWYRTSSQDMGAAYFEVVNNTDETVTLSDASAPDALVELHETLMADGVMRMEHRPEGFAIEPGETLVLEPGGKHVMLMDFTPPADGADLELTLRFSTGDVEVSARFDADASAAAADEDHSHHDHDDHDHDADDAHGEHDDDHAHGDADVAALINSLDVENLHHLDHDLNDAILSPTEQLPVVEHALQAIEQGDWPADVDLSELVDSLETLKAALESEDLDTAAQAASTVHDLVHDLQAEHDPDGHGH